jgi:predicted MFS family arabinose efflux permease
VPLLLLGCALFGLGLGNVTSLPPLIAQAEFPAAAVPRVVGLVTALSQAGYAFAPAGFGLLRELSGAPALFAVAAAVQFAAAALVLAGRRD